MLCKYLSVAGVALLLAVPMPLLAVEAYWRPGAQMSAGHNDNIRFVDRDLGQPVDSSALFQMQVDSELGARVDDMSTSLFARYWYQSVKNVHVLNTDIEQVRWNYTNTMERGTLLVELNAQHDTTLTSEFGLTGSGISPDEKKDRHYHTGSIDYTWYFSPVNYGGISAELDSVHYLNAENSQLSSYDTRSYSTKFGHLFSERTRAGMQFSYSVFDIPTVNGQVIQNVPIKMSYKTNNSVMAGFAEYAISERDNVSVQAGVRTSSFYKDSDFFSNKDHGTGRVFSTTYKRNYETGDLQLTASRDLQPNGAGTVVEQDSVELAFRTNFTARLSSNVALTMSQQRQPVSDQVNNGDRHFSDVQIGLRYAVTEQQAIALELDERRQRLDNASRYNAESTGVYLHWYWNPPQRELH